MGEAHEVCAHLFGPAEQSLGVFAAISAPAAKRRFLVNADAAQKQGFTVEQNLRPLDLDTAKAYQVLDLIGLRYNSDLIEFRILRRPEREVCVKVNFGEAVGIRREALGYPGFRDADCDFLSEPGAAQLYPTRNLILRPLTKL